MQVITYQDNSKYWEIKIMKSWIDMIFCKVIENYEEFLIEVILY